MPPALRLDVRHSFRGLPVAALVGRAEPLAADERPLRRADDRRQAMHLTVAKILSAASYGTPDERPVVERKEPAIGIEFHERMADHAADFFVARQRLRFAPGHSFVARNRI